MYHVQTFSDNQQNLKYVFFLLNKVSKN